MSASTSATKIAWDVVCGKDTNEQQVFEALELLSNSRHNLGRVTLQQASALASFISSQNTPPQWLSQSTLNATINVWHLLSCWAAQLRSTLSASAPAAAATNTSLLSKAVSQACRLLVACRHGVISGTAAGLIGSILLFLGNASYGLAEDQRMQSLQQVTAILHECAPDVVASPAFVDVAAGVGHLLASTQAEQVANVSLLSTIIACYKRAGTAEESVPDLIALMPFYDMMRSASRGSHSSPVSQPHSAAFDWAAVLVTGMRSASLVERAAVSLCCGGFLEAGGTRLSTRPPATAVLLAEALLQASSEAAAACDSAGGSIPPGLRLWQDALALSTWKASEACGLPQLSVDTWQCQLRAVLGGCLRLDGVFDSARAQQPAAHASAWLRRQIAGAPAQLAGPLGRMVAGLYRHMGPAQQQHLRSAVHHGSRSLHAAYSSFTLHTAPAWIQELDQGAVRQMLDKLFMSYLVVLSTIWEVAASSEGQQSQQETAVLVLDVLADLHFCRMRLSAHTSLIQATLSVASESVEATIGLLACLPSWSALTAVVGSVQEPAWLADALLASRMQFLFNVLTPCVAASPKAAVDRGTPAMLLFLQHPSPAMCNAAHAYFCGLVQAAPPDLRDSLAGAYLERALPAYPAVVPAASLALGVDTLARALPVNSPASPRAAQQVAYRTIQLLQQPLQQEAAMELSRMLFQLLLVIDINAFDEALAAAELVVLNSPHDRRTMLCTELFKTVSGSDDYVRKLSLTRWYQQLVANLDCAVDSLSQTSHSKDATS